MVTSNGCGANGRSAHESAQGPSTNEGPAPHPLDPLLSHLADLREQAGLYAEATADRVKLTVRQAAVRAALGCLALLAGSAVVITAAVLMLNGVAGGIGALLGDRLWAGQLITGVLILAALAAGAWWGARSFTDSSRRNTLQKYERRHAQSLHAHAEAQRFRQGPPV